MKFKDFINEKNNSSIKTLELMSIGGFPISPKFWQGIETVKVQGMHATDVSGIWGILDMVGTKKGLSVFTVNENIKRILSGLLTNGGVIIKLEGTRVISYANDLHSERDKQGRKWIGDADYLPEKHRKIFKEMQADLIQNYYAFTFNKFFQTLDKLGMTLADLVSKEELESKEYQIEELRDAIYKKTIEDDIWYFAKTLLWMIYKMGNSVKKDLIGKYYKKANSLFSKNIDTFKDLFLGDALNGNFDDTENKWNEIILTDIEVLEIHIDPSVFDDIEKQEFNSSIEDLMMVLTMNELKSSLKDAQEFNKRQLAKV